MKILFLTNNKNTEALYTWLLDKCFIQVCHEKLEGIEQLRTLSPDIVISYNYRYIIQEDIIEYMKGKIYNLHTSYLPWNKGADANFWSFYEDTPKGVTIHQIDKGLDTGKILYQKQCILKPEEETFQTSYDKLHQMMDELFKEKWEEIKAGTYPLVEQKGEGSYHAKRELIELREKHPFDWSDNIAEYLRRSR